MSIKVGDKDLFPYLGDYRPVNIYKGEHKVAGWKWTEQSGKEILLNGESPIHDRVTINTDENYASFRWNNAHLPTNPKNGGEIMSTHYPTDSREYVRANQLQIYSYPDSSAAFFITDYTMTLKEFKQKLDNSPVTVLYEVESPTVETLSQELQDKLNNLRSFQGSNYIYTMVENLKPTLHARLKVKDI